ncbi:hypothetical protein K490DRAFT_56025 [Saccharata proteae CBS 121410]|uniref:Uncharacterized protein n=1 Tax=Saccharata proteae CBS 121410 TaxID=1314787 RepID=A0A9P4HYA3_9PEZI|nr:hypothetical protein K490DRAFT_56025 [Saccharata proteae CBS 121410]
MQATKMCKLVPRPDSLVRSRWAPGGMYHNAASAKKSSDTVSSAVQAITLHERAEYIQRKSCITSPAAKPVASYSENSELPEDARNHVSHTAEAKDALPCPATHIMTASLADLDNAFKSLTVSLAQNKVAHKDGRSKVQVAHNEDCRDDEGRNQRACNDDTSNKDVHNEDVHGDNKDAYNAASGNVSQDETADKTESLNCAEGIYSVSSSDGFELIFTKAEESEENGMISVNFEGGASSDGEWELV